MKRGKKVGKPVTSITLVEERAKKELKREMCEKDR